jgi:hypothetical protein
VKLALVVMAPPAAIADAICDRTCELADGLAHVQSATPMSRHLDADGCVVSVQRWRAKASVPALLKPHLEESLLDWTLTFERRPGALDCRWHAESAARQLPHRCHGTMQFLPAIGGRATRIDLRCEFAAANEGLRTIFGRLLAEHWRSIADAAARGAAAASAPSLPAA